MNLLDNIKIWRPMGGSTVGNGGAGASTFVDCLGAGGVLFLMTASSNVKSTGTILVQQSSAQSTGLGIYQSTFSNAVKGSTSTWNVWAIDVARPLKRYVRLKLLTCTGYAVTPLVYNLGRAGSTENQVYLETISGVHICTS